MLLMLGGAGACHTLRTGGVTWLMGWESLLKVKQDIGGKKRKKLVIYGGNHQTSTYL